MIPELPRGPCGPGRGHRPTGLVQVPKCTVRRVVLGVGLGVSGLGVMGFQGLGRGVEFIFGVLGPKP